MHLTYLHEDGRRQVDTSIMRMLPKYGAGGLFISQVVNPRWSGSSDRDLKP